MASSGGITECKFNAFIVYFIVDLLFSARGDKKKRHCETACGRQDVGCVRYLPHWDGYHFIARYSKHLSVRGC